MRRRLLPLLAPVLLLAGCGIDDDVVAREAARAGATPVDDTTTTTTLVESEPEPVRAFEVDEVPDGFEVVVEGAGEEEADDEVVPVTVLAPDGEPASRGTVLVEAVADAEDGYEEEAAGRWSSLVAEGLRAWGVEAAEDDLQAVLDAATAPDDEGGAPTVEEPPGDLEVVGSITADGVVGLRAVVPDEDDAPVPGPTSAQVATFACEDGDECSGSLVVLALPAGALDPAAVVAQVRTPRRGRGEARDAVADEIEVGDETGVVTTTARAEDGEVLRRELAVVTGWGDVLVVISRGDAPLDAEALAAVAASVAPA